MYPHLDFTMLMYSIRTLLGLTIFLLFVVLWYRHRNMPTLLACMVFLIISDIFVDIYHYWSRYNSLVHPEVFREIRVAWHWPARLIPGVIVYAYVVIHVAVLVLCPKKLNRNRRIDD